jgi:hypothetical protein
MVTDNSNINRKAFQLALHYTFMGMLYDLAMHPENDKPDADGHDPFLKHALTELGFDPGREIDDQLIAEAIPKLRERGLDFDRMVEIVVEEMEVDEANL